MYSRRKFVFASMAGLAACRRKPTGYPGYAFVANQEGGAVAVVDLESFALALHIRLDANPSQVAGSPGSERVYALTPGNGTIHEIRTDALTFARKLQVANSAVAMRLSRDAKRLAVACAGDQRSITLVATEGLKVVSQTPLPPDPLHIELSADGRYAVVI